MAAYAMPPASAKTAATVKASRFGDILVLPVQGEPVARLPTTVTSGSGRFKRPATARQLVLDLADVDTGDGEQRVEMEDHVCRLLDEPPIAGRRRDRCLDGLLAELLRGSRDARIRELGDVRPFGPFAHALDDGAPERRREATGGAGVTRRAGRRNAEKDCVAVAVVPQLLDGERVS